MLIAITATAIGFAFDAGAGSKQLSLVFAGCYVIGCLAAVLAVRQSAVFTAVIQPPLVLFVSVPTAYFLFTSGQIEGLKDLAINCGYPLIERFPLMFFTSASVLLIGMVRWYIGMATRRAAPAREDADDEPSTGFASALTAKVSSLFGRDDEDDVDDVPPPRRRRPASERPASERASRPARANRERAARERGERPAKRTAASRSRHVRPPETEIIEPVADRPRRTRRQAEPPDTGEPRRRARTSNPRQPGPPPSERRSRYDRNGYERPGYERNGYDRSERRRRLDDYQPREPHSSNGNGSGNGSGTHHPVSRVRYRGEENDDRAEYRTRRRGGWEADSWEYDV
ncbi:hypothetical protein SAMN04489835_2812 [Mycolicibacterium rutilum]|uniref:DUF6542 domain-containing protein n=1 Tax=Mycolicibacterium rutilum TaxID=370526 RepID=A0A1H6K9A9_MYCRU|nr:hypothetical protein SAMN04489835_2812 [Mycolicibacterium rutilum]